MNNYELDITRFFNEASPSDYSASQMELGRDAGKITWNHACDDSAEYMLLDTEEKRDTFRRFVKGFGAWSEAEIAAWPDSELNALCIQFISGDLREAGLTPDSSAADWREYERQAHEGLLSSRLFRAANGRIYFYIGE